MIKRAIVCALAMLFVAAGSVHAQDPRPEVQQGPAARVSLSPDSFPNPVRVSVVSRVDAGVQDVSEACRAHIDAEPTLIVDYTGADEILQIEAASERASSSDLSVTVRAPDGSWQCPRRQEPVSYAAAAPGRYEVWARSYWHEDVRITALTLPPDDADGVDVDGGFGPPTRRTALPGAGFQGGRSVPTIGPPPFPRWPPPAASARAEIDRAVFGSDETYGEVAQRLTLAMRRAGNMRQSYYGVPGGFAVVAQLEKLQSDARPELGATRFLTPNEDTRSLRNNPLDALAQLFFAPEGAYRQIAFIVSDRAFQESGAEMSSEEAADLLASGGMGLGGASARPFTSAHRVTALIYEFTKTGDQDAELRAPGRWSADTHLARSGVMGRLQRR